MSIRITHRAAFAAFTLALLCGVAQAAQRIYTVGTEESCNFASIQAAVDAAQLHDDGDGTDYIHIANTGTYAAQAIEIGAQDLVLEGGYASCANNAPSGSTTLSGVGNGGASVLRITGGGVRVLRNLQRPTARPRPRRQAELCRPARRRGARAAVVLQPRIERRLRAYRWQYIVSGVQDPRFQQVLGDLTTEAQRARIGAALAPLLQ